MNVKDILDEKGRDVVTIGENASVSDVIAQLADKKIGATIVATDDNRILGIISERDIVRVLSAHGAGALDMAVSLVMTRKVLVCSESHSIDHVMETMTNGRFRHLPIEEEGRLAGLVSIGDVVRKRIEQVEREAEQMKSYISG